MSKIIGIDLGTTTSEIAYVKDGVPVIISNDKYGYGTVIPSVVTIKDNEIVVGKTAKRQIVARAESTVCEVKRLMGSGKKVVVNGVEYLPEQISAMILKTLKEIAEEEIGPVDEAVITVPAAFNDLQRNATKDAAEIAGLKVERIINEPTAAALSYGIQNFNEESKILVYDLGGGTFDCTVLEMFEGIIDVKASRGNNTLGGKDFDERVEEYIKDYIKNNTSIDVENLSLKRKGEIKEAAETAKKDLSVEESTEIVLNNFGTDENGDSIDIDLTLTREKFNELTKDLIEKTVDIIDETLSASNLTYDEIDVVLAIGGSSRMMSVQELLYDRFKDKVKKGVNPDEAVALGAAVQAAIKNDDISSENGLIIADACSYTLGVAMVEDKFSPLIFRDTKLPAKVSQIYSTVLDDQTGVVIKVYQGQNENVNNNTFVGKFVLEDIPPAEAGKEKIEITFQYDLNGMLNVSAKILSTGKVESRVMSTNGLKKEEISELKKSTFKGPSTNEPTLKSEKSVEKQKKQLDDDSWMESGLYDKVKVSVTLAQNKLSTVDDKTKEKINTIIEDMKKAIIDGRGEELEILDETLTDLLFELD
ncbi:MAG: Hsp70 family protein [Clostridium sp.]|nr:Hsp70 family protein [Clostridium sp.]